MSGEQTKGTVGRAQVPTDRLVLEEFPFTAEDLEMHTDLGPAKVPGLQKIRVQHHTYAMMLANGYPPAEVAEITHIHVKTLEKLMNSPAFMGLVEHYRGKVNDRLGEVTRRATAALMTGLGQVQAKLSDPEQMADTSLKELTGTVTALSDRVGLGPVSTHQTRDVGLTREEISGLKEIAKREEITIPAEVTPGDTDSRGAHVGPVSGAAHAPLPDDVDAAAGEDLREESGEGTQPELPFTAAQPVD